MLFLLPNQGKKPLIKNQFINRKYNFLMKNDIKRD